MKPGDKVIHKLTGQTITLISTAEGEVWRCALEKKDWTYSKKWDMWCKTAICNVKNLIPENGQLTKLK